MIHSSCWVVGAALVLLSCGGEATSGVASDGGPEAGPAGSAGTAHGGARGGGTGGSGGIGGSGGSELPETGPAIEPDCTGFDDATPRNVNVVYSNQRSTPIFVTPDRRFQPGTRFRIVDAAGDQLELFPDYCGFGTCEILQKGSPSCDAGLAWVPVIRIDPGGSFTETWNGLAAVERKMPATCYPDSGRSSCSQMLGPAPGTYSVAAGARTECAQCMCEPSSSGSCAAPLGFYDAGLAGESLETSINVALPTAAEIVLTFR